MKLKSLFLFFVFLFYACSWTEYFVISNNSKENIWIEFTVHSNKKGSPIFNIRNEIYTCDKKGRIIRENKIPISPIVKNDSLIQLILPPNSSFILGVLHNDKYYSPNQKFINDGCFNFQSLTVKKNQNSLWVDKANFETYFKRQNGSVLMLIE